MVDGEHAALRIACNASRHGFRNSCDDHELWLVGCLLASLVVSMVGCVDRLLVGC